jgi:hypothetical protein
MSRDRAEVDEWVNRLPLTYRFPRSVEQAFGPGQRHVDAVEIGGQKSRGDAVALAVSVVVLVGLLVAGVLSMATRPASQTRALIEAQEGLQCVPDALPPGYVCTTAKEPAR